MQAVFDAPSAVFDAPSAVFDAPSAVFDTPCALFDTPYAVFNAPSAVFVVQVHLEVSCWFVQDQLRGDPVTELRVKFVKRLEDSVPPGED